MITKRQAMTLGLALALSACAQPMATGPSGTVSDPSIAQDQAFAQREIARPGAHYQVQLTYSFWTRYRSFLLRRRIAMGIEDQLLALVNAERAKAGLGALTMDTTMRNVARSHSIDMIAKSYFAHNAPDGTTPDSRLTAAGVTFNSWAENIVNTGASDNIANDMMYAAWGWMNSAPHKANILNGTYTRTGIGVWKDATTGKAYATEVFAN
jgi:uncharacterized protein YkwD